MRYLHLCLVTALLAGCAGNDILVQRQGSLEGRLNQVMQAQNTASTQLAELSLQVKELKSQIDRQSSAEKATAAEIATLQVKIASLGRQLENRGAQGTVSPPSRIELVNGEESGGSREEKIQAAYMQAFGLFSANNYGAAAEAFTSFIASYPESEDAANARYWLGECHYAEGRYQKAIDTFARVLETNPTPARGGEAMLKTALSWISLNERDKGRATLRALQGRYPDSPAAARAAELLQSN